MELLMFISETWVYNRISKMHVFLVATESC